MKLYEKLCSLKQRDMSLVEYTSEFDNLSVQVSLNKSKVINDVSLPRRLECIIRDKMGVMRLFNLEDARQYALMAKRKAWCFGARKLYLSALMVCHT